MTSIHTNVQNMLDSRKTGKLSSKEFIYAYWKKHDGLKSTININTYRRLTDPETIARSRRLILSQN